MTVNISGQVPGEQQNGIIAIEDEFLDERTPDAIYAVVKIERASLKYNDVKQEWSATIRFPHIEPILNEADIAAAKALLERAYSARNDGANGQTPLDIVEPALDLDTPLQDGSAV
jgi:hypothetical protein